MNRRRQDCLLIYMRKTLSRIVEVMCGFGSNLYSNFNSETVGIPNIEFTDTSSPRANAITYGIPFTVKEVLYRITADRMPCLPVS